MKSAKVWGVNCERLGSLARDPILAQPRRVFTAYFLSVITFASAFSVASSSSLPHSSSSSSFVLSTIVVLTSSLPRVLCEEDNDNSRSSGGGSSSSRIGGEDPLVFLNIPKAHLPYFLNSHPHLRDLYCTPSSSSSSFSSSACVTAATEGVCWGYEPHCVDPRKRYFPPLHCEGGSRSWATSKEDQQEQFFQHGDFGYIRKRLKEMVSICTPRTKSDSSLRCTQYLRYCQGRYLYLDLRKLLTRGSSANSERFREDVFAKGQIGGSCLLDGEVLSSNSAHKSPLQSWFAELESFSSLDFKPSKSKKRCQVRISKPTFFLKLDAGVNMFHHFCDFINLYMSQHLNGSFSLDVNIVMWDTTDKGYHDLFAETWAAFSKNPIIPLASFDGKRVCFDQFVFTLSPRMRYGHFYNMPLMPGCHGTGLYKAFSHHVLHRLSVPQRGPTNKIRVSVLERRTKYRNIENQGELVSLLRQDPDVEVKVVYYSTGTTLSDQLTSTHNSDVLIGMHGAGLTHLLFLPDWAAIFELYACDDGDCYYNLARLRGVKYFTWERNELMYPRDEGHHPTTGGPHPKFTDYSFDPDEFHRIVREAVDHVKAHPEYIEARRARNEHADDDNDGADVDGEGKFGVGRREEL